MKNLLFLDNSLFPKNGSKTDSTEFKGRVRWWMGATVARPLDLLRPKFCDTHHFAHHVETVLNLSEKMGLHFFPFLKK